jgi:hypothetical protein
MDRGGVGSTDYLWDDYQKTLNILGPDNRFIDPTRYQFNQDPFWAENFAEGRDFLAQAAAGREAPQFDPDMDGYNTAALQGAEAREQAIEGIDRLSGSVDQFGNQLPIFEQDVQNIRDVAEGRGGPSAAELAMRRSSDEAMRQNLAMAATGARGGSAAGSFLNAGVNNSIAQGGLTRDLGIQRAQEQQAARAQLLQGQQNITDAYDSMAQGRGMVVDAYGNVRDQDIGTAGMAGDIALRTEEGRVGAQLDQQRQNDQMVQFLMSQGYDAQKAQLMANIEMDQNRTGNNLENRRIQAGIPPKEDKSFIEEAMPWIQGGATVAGAAAMVASDRSCKEGVRPIYSDADSKEQIRRLEHEKAVLAALASGGGSPVVTREGEHSRSVDEAARIPWQTKEENAHAWAMRAAEMDTSAPPVRMTPRYQVDIGAAQVEPPRYEVAIGQPQDIVYPQQAPVSTVVSDERSKEKIAALEGALAAVTAPQFAGQTVAPTLTQPDTDILDMAYNADANRTALAPMQPYSYRYKPNVAAEIGEDTERRDGIMAQDMEKSPAGASVVMDTPNGKALDMSRAVSFSLAANAGLDKRLSELEQRESAILDALGGGTEYPTVRSDVANKEDVSSEGSGDFWDRVAVASKSLANMDPTITAAYMRDKKRGDGRDEPTPKREDTQRRSLPTGMRAPPTATPPMMRLMPQPVRAPGPPQFQPVTPPQQQQVGYRPPWMA